MRQLGDDRLDGILDRLLDVGRKEELALEPDALVHYGPTAAHPVEHAMAAKEITRDIGGKLGTIHAGAALAERIANERHGG